MVNQLFLWAIFNSKLLVYQRVPILAKSWVPSRSWPLRLSASPDQRPSSGICLRGNEKSWAKRRLNHSSSPSNLQVMQLLFPCDPHMIPIWFSYIITILGSKLWSPKIYWPIFFCAPLDQLVTGRLNTSHGFQKEWGIINVYLSMLILNTLWILID